MPGIERLADRAPQVGLAVSFHAATDELRDELVPPNKRYPLAKLEAAIAGWRAKTRRRPSIEWAMIAGTNDSDEQARALAPIAKRLGAHVNLIPLNPTPGSPAQPSSQRRIHGFVRVLKASGVNVTVRRHARPADRRRVRPAAAGARRRISGVGREPELSRPSGDRNVTDEVADLRRSGRVVRRALRDDARSDPARPGHRDGSSGRSLHLRLGSSMPAAGRAAFAVPLAEHGLLGHAAGSFGGHAAGSG